MIFVKDKVVLDFLKDLNGGECSKQMNVIMVHILGNITEELMCMID